METNGQLMGTTIVLRRFRASDAPCVQHLAGHPDIADTTLTIPHPYPDGAAEAWIATHAGLFDQGGAAIFAIVTRADERLVGCIGLTIRREHRRAEVGYWIGRDYWGHGYCTAALNVLLDYGFTQLHLNRMFAHHFLRNPASGRVMEKAGMQREGLLREHLFTKGKFEDVVLYALLREEFMKSRPVGSCST